MYTISYPAKRVAFRFIGTSSQQRVVVCRRYDHNHFNKTELSTARQKWTHEMRFLMYDELRWSLGPYKNEPSRFHVGKSKEIDAVLRRIQNKINERFEVHFALTAIGSQIDWAVTDQTSLKHSSYFRNWILNKGAALEAGFITIHDLPSEVSVRE